ncbi:MAG: Trk system potassium transporter TrkA [Oscillospiraceae bacterium]|nr:Trk system potassium transporter TrkA [Oscillospiraceae bacterium]
MITIVVGAGKIGYAIAEHLVSEGHDLTLVDSDPEALEDALSGIDAICVLGNGASRGTLVRANAGEADLVISFTESDEINLLCCLLAKKLGAQHTIARVRKPEYYDDIELIRGELRLSSVINPERAVAEEIVRILEFEGALNAETFAKGKVELITFEVTADCQLCSRSVKDVFSRLKTEALLCAVERGEKVFIPSGDFVINEGDLATVVAPLKSLTRFLREVGVGSGRAKSVMIIGGGRICSYLASALLEAGNEVTIIEIDREKAEKLAVDFPRANVINANGSDPDLLREERIEEFDAFCTLTGIDEENIMLSLYAKTLGDIKTVTKVNQQMYRDIARSLGLGSVISSKSVASNIVLRYVRALHNGIGSKVETLYKIISGKAEALEFKVEASSSLIGVPLERLSLKKELLLACIIRKNGGIVMPHGKDCIEAGDTAIVVTTINGLDDLDDILEERQGL